MPSNPLSPKTAWHINNEINCVQTVGIPRLHAPVVCGSQTYLWICSDCRFPSPSCSDDGTQERRQAQGRVHAVLPVRVRRRVQRDSVVRGQVVFKHQVRRCPSCRPAASWLPLRSFRFFPLLADWRLGPRHFQGELSLDFSFHLCRTARVIHDTFLQIWCSFAVWKAIHSHNFFLNTYLIFHLLLLYTPLTY